MDPGRAGLGGAWPEWERPGMGSRPAIQEWSESLGLQDTYKISALVAFLRGRKERGGDYDRPAACLYERPSEVRGIVPPEAGNEWLGRAAAAPTPNPVLPLALARRPLPRRGPTYTWLPWLAARLPPCRGCSRPLPSPSPSEIV